MSEKSSGGGGGGNLVDTVRLEVVSSAANLTGIQQGINKLLEFEKVQDRINRKIQGGGAIKSRPPAVMADMIKQMEGTAGKGGVTMKAFSESLGLNSKDVRGEFAKKLAAYQSELRKFQAEMSAIGIKETAEMKGRGLKGAKREPIAPDIVASLAPRRAAIEKDIAAVKKLRDNLSQAFSNVTLGENMTVKIPQAAGKFFAPLERQ